jgi:hypothetical protein
MSAGSGLRRIRVRVKVNCASLRYKWSTAPVKFGF